MRPTSGDGLEQYLAQADPDAIHSAFLRLVPEFREGRWLQPHNPFVEDAVRAVGRLAEVGGSSRGELAEYVSVSTILHCFDGWSFFGRALAAAMLGDGPSATHFAYYAELRSAMSILACEGIGTFDRVHVVIGSDGGSVSSKELRQNYSTHKFAWRAIQNWAGRSGPRVLERIVAPWGISMSEWLNAFKAGGGIRKGLATRTIEDYGFDMKRAESDRGVRNEASYRPGTLRPFSGRTDRESVRFVVELWRRCEPSGGTAFRMFDLELVRQQLRSLSPTAGEGGGDDGRGGEYVNRVRAMLGGFSISKGEKRLIEGFLLTDASATPMIAEQARRTVELGGDAVPVLARAFGLLRLATGCVRDLLASLDDDRRDLLDFWWMSPSVNRQLWRPERPPTDCADLWRDAEEAMGRIETSPGWEEESGPEFDFWKDYASDLVVLSSTERICLWGLGL